MTSRRKNEDHFGPHVQCSKERKGGKETGLGRKTGGGKKKHFMERRLRPRSENAERNYPNINTMCVDMKEQSQSRKERGGG